MDREGLLVEAFWFQVLGSSLFSSSLLAQAVVLWFAQAAWFKLLYCGSLKLLGSTFLVQACWFKLVGSNLLVQICWFKLVGSNLLT